jgi:hypothetical protein
MTIEPEPATPKRGSKAMGTIHPQYVTDQDGKRVSVLLPLDEFETLLEDLQDLQVAMKVRNEPTMPWESVKGELGIG